MLRPALIAALLALPYTALAQDRQAATGRPPQRIRDVTVMADQTCPQSTDTEVVVCHRLEEPYRIPKALRDAGPVTPGNQSWAARSAAVEATGRAAGGLPDTCSAVGTGGQSGCAMLGNQAWAAEERARRAEASSASAAGASTVATPSVSGDGAASGR